MEFNFQGCDTQKQHHQLYTMTSPSSSSSNIFFSHQTMNEGLLSGGSGDMTEAIHRNLEKKMIREEILADEIFHRRYLEAEVRRELMIEREMTRQSGGGFPSPFMLGPLGSHCYRFEPGILHGQSFSPDDRRIVQPIQEIYSGNGRHPFENCGPEAEVVPFGGSPKIQESTRSLPVDGRREFFIGLGKPSGANRKPPPQRRPVVAGSSELHSCSLKKKIQEEWSCAICKISATCEHDFNEHLAGKKHQATLRAHNPSADMGLEKNSPLVIKNSRKCVSEEDLKIKGESMRQKFRFWCEMCKAGAYVEEDMNKHKKGKKHLKNLDKLHRKSGCQKGRQRKRRKQHL